MDDRLTQYIEEHIDMEPEELHRLDRLTNIRLHNGRMCSGHLQGRFLKTLTAMAAPGRVLELGTFSGYSALCIAEGLAEQGLVDTVEVDDELEDFIREAIESSPHGAKVRLHIGAALDVMASFTDGEFDMVFMDADKKEYPAYYEEALRLLKRGGWILADNTLWSGHVVEEEYFRDRQTAAIRRFNDIVGADPRVEKVILPIRDGLTIIRKL